jgi:hypothetical protein
MTGGELISCYPRLYHLAYFSAWPSIQKHGLLGTTALLDMYGIKGRQRLEIESQGRSKAVTITHPVHGSAVIRDQKVLPESKLLLCLKKGNSPMSSRQWYESLNRRVFFWSSMDDFEKLNGAKEYRSQDGIMMEIDTARLLSKHASSVTLCSKNSGAARYIHPLNSRTHQPLGDNDFVLTKNGRPRKAVREIAVDYAVPDVLSHTITVKAIEGGKIGKVIWP